MENKLVKVIRICLVDILIDYLYQNQIYSKQYYLLNLLRCCKTLQKLLTTKIIRMVTFNYNSISEWTNKTRIERLNVNCTWPYYSHSDLPPNLVHIYFSCNHIKHFKEGELPNSLKSIHFDSDNDFNQYFLKNDLPNNITELKFGWSYNQPFLPNVLPKNLIKLTFGHCYNQPMIKNVFTK